MIKVFTTTNSNPNTDGDVLTLLINHWMEDIADIEILNIHSNSNKFGWMVLIEYKFK